MPEAKIVSFYYSKKDAEGPNNLYKKKIVLPIPATSAQCLGDIILNISRGVKLINLL